MDTTAYTILLLESLKPGQKITYYRGDLESDIESCKPGIGGAAPRYEALLRSIQEHAWRLAKNGQIKLSEENARHFHRRGTSVYYVEYTAIGV